MKVLHLSAANEFTGAGKATVLTHDALLKHGIESRILFLKSNLNSSGVYSFHNQSAFSKFLRLIVTFIEQLPLKLYPNRTSSIFSPGLIGLHLKGNRLIKWSDIIHIHWTNHGFVDISEIQSWNKPIVWTLRDMWAFTGGCHYAFLCTNFKSNCGNCPELGSNCEKDLSKYLLQRKMKYFRHSDITWVAISSWMQKQANDSTLLNDKYVAIVHSGVDVTRFYVADKMEVRAKLKLPLDKKIILLGAENIRARYKGYEFARNVLNLVKSEFLVVTFGTGSFKDSEIPQQNIHFGELNYSQLCELYNAADVFLGPSIAEAMGKTFLEAQLCGLPVVCFDETGPADIVKHKETGYLAKYQNSDDLKIGLDFCLNTKFDPKKISSRACELFDISKIIVDYIEIYEKSIVAWTNSNPARYSKI